MRIDCGNKVRWNRNLVDRDQNEKFFKVMKSKSRYAKHVQIPGTHLLHMTNPLGVTKELIDFIPEVESKIQIKEKI